MKLRSEVRKAVLWCEVITTNRCRSNEPLRYILTKTVSETQTRDRTSMMSWWRPCEVHRQHTHTFCWHTIINYKRAVACKLRYQHWHGVQHNHYCRKELLVAKIWFDIQLCSCLSATSYSRAEGRLELAETSKRFPNQATGRWEKEGSDFVIYNTSTGVSCNTFASCWKSYS